MVSMPTQCSNPWCRLTPRQLELLECVIACPGATNRELAQQMSVSERTVKKHFYDIYRAMGVLNRSECLTRLFREGFETAQTSG